MNLRKEQLRKAVILGIACLILVISLIAPVPDGLGTEGPAVEEAKEDTETNSTASQGNGTANHGEDDPEFGREAMVMIGILFMAAVLWMGEPLPMPVTGLIVLIMPSILIGSDILPPADVFSAFGNEAVFFLIGAFMLAAAIEKHNLHKRLALRFLVHFERSPQTFILGLMAAGALLSFIMPEHAVVALLLPIALSILVETGVIPGKSNFGKAVMIGIAFGCSLGSLATPIGGARNPYTIGFLAEKGISISFFQWMLYALPMVVIGLPVIWLLLIRLFPPEIDDLSSTRTMLSEQISALGKPDRNTKVTTGVYAFTILLWMLFHDYNLAIIALIGALFMFITGAVTWKDVERRVPWGIILLYGGAITMGKFLHHFGASDWIAGSMLNTVGTDPHVILLMLIVISVFLTNLMSNTAAVAMLLPIGYSLGEQLDALSPEVCCMTIALSGGLAFALVIATPGNLITYSSGHYNSRELFRAGIPATLSTICIMFLIAITYWKLIELW